MTNATATAKKRRDPVATRARILDAARHLLAAGNGELEMSWVAKEAGVSQGLAYHHFGSKDGLLAAVVNDFYDRVEEAVLMAKLDDIADWETRERTRSERYIRFLTHDPLGPLLATQLAQSPAVAAIEAERWSKLIEEGARNIAEGQRRGVIVNPQRSDLLAAMVLGSIRSTVQRVLQTDQSHEPAQLTEEIWRFLSPGLDIKQDKKAVKDD